MTAYDANLRHNDRIIRRGIGAIPMIGTGPYAFRYKGVTLEWIARFRSREARVMAYLSYRKERPWMRAVSQ